MCTRFSCRGPPWKCESFVSDRRRDDPQTDSRVVSEKKKTSTYRYLLSELVNQTINILLSLLTLYLHDFNFSEKNLQFDMPWWSYKLANKHLSIFFETVYGYIVRVERIENTQNTGDNIVQVWKNMCFLFEISTGCFKNWEKCYTKIQFVYAVYRVSFITKCNLQYYSINRTKRTET